jgi:mannose/fructose/N-acetylgalactosamine-specific phosphotransferase system component IID
MTREEVFIRILLFVIVMSIYTCFMKWKSYREGFSDGIKYYSSMVEEILHHIKRFNKEAEEAGMDISACIESIRPLNETESEGLDCGSN